ncbi:MAG: NifB/NifX family molybdenum-iron cluster-binding protein [Chloroflexota bacterium]
MRYAVPVTDGKVAEHFGHCTHFAFFDVDPSTGEIAARETAASPGHQPGVLPTWLAEQGVSVVLAGGMGSRAQALFRENRIEVAIGVLEEDPEKAVQAHVRGSLAVGDNVCDH